MKKLLIAWTPIIVWASLIFSLSNYPTGSASQVILTDFLFKKTAHMVEYGILAGLIYRMFKIYKIEEQDSGVYAVVLAMMYGISDEFHQSMIPGRTARPYDVLFDTIGAAVAILLIWNILQILSKKHKKWPKKLGII